MCQSNAGKLSANAEGLVILMNDYAVVIITSLYSLVKNITLS